MSENNLGSIEIKDAQESHEIHPLKVRSKAQIEHSKILQSLSKEAKLLKEEKDRLVNINKKLESQALQIKAKFTALKHQYDALKKQQQAKDKTLLFKISQLQQYHKYMDSIASKDKKKSPFEASNSYNSLFCKYKEQLQYCLNVEVDLINTKSLYKILQYQYNSNQENLTNQIECLKAINSQLRSQYSTLRSLEQKQRKIMQDENQEYLEIIQKVNAKNKQLKWEKKVAQRMIETNKKLHEAQYNKLVDSLNSQACFEKKCYGG